MDSSLFEKAAIMMSLLALKQTDKHVYDAAWRMLSIPAIGC